ncbi:MAG: DUF4476 domain-containing protein [Chitinophagaceae bacterium]|nr:DUF4476 domain-containing protein [Chitinophagaceae bacterium]
MKKTSTLLTALFFSAILFAQSKLSISASGNADIRVMVDGIRYTSNGRDIVISNLKNGNHSVKIFRASNERNRYNGNNRSNGYQLVYSNNLFVKPQYHVDITINRFGKAFVDEQVISGGYNDDDDDWGVDNNDQYYDRGSRRAMDNNAFQQLKQSIGNESFDNTRLKVAKQFIATNYFTTAQVKELVLLFSFENSRLDIAKYAYDYTVDKGNYFLINDAFSFSNSKDALMDYIKNRK